MNARRAAVAALVAAAIVVLVVVLTSGDSDYTIKAEFKDVGGLRPNSSVKIAGVPAGKVEDLEVTGRDTAIATLKLKENAAPIGRGATIKVRPTDLLGERYAELDPGNRSAPVPSGSRIDVRATSTPVELDDVLNMLDDDTRTRLGVMVNEVGTSLAGRGADFNKLLASLPPSLQDTQKLIDEVNGENAALRSVIVKGDRITAAVNAKRDDMGALIDEAASALSTVAAKRQALGATITNAPGALRQLRATLGDLDSASVALKPTARELQRTAAPLGATLSTLPQFADQAAPTLKTATNVAPALARLGRKASPTIRRLGPTSEQLRRTLEPADPALSHMTRRGTDDLLYFIHNVNRGLRGRDGVGHYIGAHIYFDPEMITNAVNVLNGYNGGDKRKPAKRAPARKVDLSPVTKPVKQATDKLKDTTDKVKKVLPPAVDKALGDVQKVVDGVLGSGSDGRGLLDYLLGP